jgi:Flp pilus assembly protein TadD
MENAATRTHWPIWASVVCILLVGIITYCNSFSGPFIFDDIDAIANDPQIREISTAINSPMSSTTLAGRPVARLSFAVDYAIDGLDVGIYHATNIAIHLISAILLFAIIRRTLLRTCRFSESANPLAAAIAAAWVVHPLNTEAVTYIVQRAESLAGLFYLATIYCLIRSFSLFPGTPDFGELSRAVEGVRGSTTRVRQESDPHPNPPPEYKERGKEAVTWAILSVLCCAIGMGCKEIVATAPIMALLYDRTFLSGSFAAAFRKRWAIYAGLAATWGILAYQIVGGVRNQSVGFHLGVSSLDYARTQLGAIAHYFRLCVWPFGLVLDEYGWPVARNWSDIPRFAWLIPLLMLVTIWAIWKRPKLGFLGAWFFGILVPSSGFVPIATELVAEHRMYLSLIAVISLIFIGGWHLLSRTGYATFAKVVAILIIVLLAAQTIRRNSDYHTATSIWQDTVSKRPNNARAHFNLGYSLEQSNDLPQAVEQYSAALRIEPTYYAAASRGGSAAIRSGDSAAAERFYDLAIAANPDFSAEGHLMRGQIRQRRGDADGAKSDYLAAVEGFQHLISLQPEDPQRFFLLGTAEELLNNWPAAASAYTQAMKLRPTDPEFASHLEVAQNHLKE